MDCGSVKAKLIDLVYGELPPAEDRSLREHCRNCPGCAEELAGLTETLELTRRVPEPELPPFLNQRVLANAREQAAKKQPASRWAWIFKPQVAMAAVAMIAASVVIVIAAERGIGPRATYQAAVPQQEKPGSALQKDTDIEPEYKGAGEGANGMMAEPAPASGAAPMAPAEAMVGTPGLSSPAATVEITNGPTPAPRLQAPADAMRAREEERSAGPSAAAPSGESRAQANAVAGGISRQSAPVPPPATFADHQAATGGAGAATVAQPSAPAPAIAPAPATAPPAALVPAPSSESRSGWSFRAKNKEETARSATTVGSAAPVPAPAPGAAAPAPAKPVAPAPSTPPAPAAGQAKSLAFDEEAADRMAEEAPAAAPAPPPSPAQLVATAGALENDGKYAEALASYQSALTGLGYATGKDKQPACSPTLRAALEGAGRCQAKVGKKADADATAVALKAICTQK